MIEPLSVSEHREAAPTVLTVAVLTVSDTRSGAEDTGGALIRDMLVSAGHTIGDHGIVQDEPADIADRVAAWCASGQIDAVLVTGGTGIAQRDQTPEALLPLCSRVLPGFGELFRMLSFDEVGSAAMLSRAFAGVIDLTPVIALPGSRNAIRLAMEKLVLPEIGHLVFEARKGITR